jgi:hypothetical protein
MPIYTLRAPRFDARRLIDRFTRLASADLIDGDPYIEPAGA